MCGILAILDLVRPEAEMRKQALARAKKLRHRGPDWSGIVTYPNAILAHERLAIVDVVSGAQPLVDQHKKRALTVNGEIFNFKELRHGLNESHDFQTNSDCEVILYLYDEFGPECVKHLNGMFAFVLFDAVTGDYLIARDHVGIVPLYYGWDAFGQMYVASELKAIEDVCTRIEEFPPRHYMTSNKQLVPYDVPVWLTQTPPATLSREHLKTQIAKELRAAVRRQLVCDVPYGVLISGGVDSSIIAALAAEISKTRVESGGTSPAWWPQIHSFTIGLKDSPDLRVARDVANHIQSIHHEMTFDVQEGIDAISDVIYFLETFDLTTIRAATPMYLMARKIRAMGVKMILSGEGADEIFGGYLYFHKAPNSQEMHEELVRKIQLLHKYDCLRANKATSAWGLETRVPFLDKEFLEFAMNIDPAEKMCGNGRKEKALLREAFEGVLPDQVLNRQKEQFSDGVGYGWIDSLKKHAEIEVSDVQMSNAKHAFPIKTPQTKEAYWYRSIFASLFANPEAPQLIPYGPSVACSTPTAYLWDRGFEHFQDPSGRSISGIHSYGL